MIKRSLIFSIILFSASVFGRCEISMRAHVFPPLAIKNNQQWSGIDIDYANILINAVGCKLKIVEAPWLRGLKLLEHGEIDLMVNVTKSVEREKYFYFVGPQRIEYIKLVSKKGGLPLIKTWQQLEALDAVIMRQRGSYLGEKFEQVLNKNAPLREKLVELAHNKTRLELLESGKIDAFLVDEMFLKGLPNKLKNRLEIHPLVINSNPVFYAFSKASITEARILEFRNAFEMIAKTSDFKAIN